MFSFLCGKEKEDLSLFRCKRILPIRKRGGEVRSSGKERRDSSRFPGEEKTKRLPQNRWGGREGSLCFQGRERKITRPGYPRDVKEKRKKLVRGEKRENSLRGNFEGKRGEGPSIRRKKVPGLI